MNLSSKLPTKITLNVFLDLEYQDKGVRYYASLGTDIDADIASQIMDCYSFIKNGGTIQQYMKNKNEEIKSEYEGRGSKYQKKVPFKTKLDQVLFAKKYSKTIKNLKNNISDIELCIKLNTLTKERLQGVTNFIKQLENEYGVPVVVKCNSQNSTFDKTTTENLVALDQMYKLKIITQGRGLENDHTERDLSDVLEAQEKADMLIKHIESLDLSPFEKLILIHDFCASKPYVSNDDKDLTPEEVAINRRFNCRSFVDCMTTDKIVCVGYAMLMFHFCNALGIECEIADTHNHSFNSVHLVDPKYNINGYYLVDATWDSVGSFGDSGDEPTEDMQSTKNYMYLAFPWSEEKDQSHEASRYRMRYGDSSHKIGAKTLKLAVENAYKKLDGEDYDQETIDKNIECTLKRAKNNGMDPYPFEIQNEKKASMQK